MRDSQIRPAGLAGSALPYAQGFDTALEARIGREGASGAALDGALARADEALRSLRAQHADGSLRHLTLPAERGDLDDIRKAASSLTGGASDVVMLGTGGSSLGGQTLAQLADYAVPGLGTLRAAPRLHFIDNLDAGTFDALLGRLDLKAARFVAISKSGGTAETLMQTISVLAALKGAGLTKQLPQNFLGLTEPEKAGRRNQMRDLLGAHGIPMINHDLAIGGRYSALTNVGLLPAAILGLDIAAVRAGAQAVLAPILSGAAARDVPCAAGAGLSVALAETRGKSIAVMMAYADRLERFTKWFVQLWGESLGKNGKGTTPVAALGPVDQHSQLQLYIGGPRDKLVTVITTGAKGRGSRLPDDLSKLVGEPDFAGRTLGDLVAAEGRATADTLAKNGCPVRTIHLEKLDEFGLGALFMHFMLETIIAGRLLGVDPFDQPAVEEGKILAKKYLAGKS